MMAKKRSTPRSGKQDDPERVDFESSLAEVERIVARLESGELGLTESLQDYETGIGQLKRCHALLDAAEQRVSVLSGFDADGNPLTAPLSSPVSKTTRGPSGDPSGMGRGAATTTGQEGCDDALSDADRRRDNVDDFPGLF
jgi:exodeoxyribonuclease VII small subunit